MVDHVVALERPPHGVEQAPEYGEGFHHPQLAVLHAALVQVIAGARRFDAGRGHVIAFEVEAHRAVPISRQRYEVATRSQGRAATAQVVGTQGDPVDIGLDVDNHPGAPPLILAGQGHALRPHHQGAVEVHATGDFFAER